MATIAADTTRVQNDSENTPIESSETKVTLSVNNWG